MNNNNIRILRKQQGLTQTQLANMTGLSQRAISEIENRIRPIKREELTALALIFHISEEEIWKGKNWL